MDAFYVLSTILRTKARKRLLRMNEKIKNSCPHGTHILVEENNICSLIHPFKHLSCVIMCWALGKNICVLLDNEIFIYVKWLVFLRTLPPLPQQLETDYEIIYTRYVCCFSSASHSQQTTEGVVLYSTFLGKAD